MHKLCLKIYAFWGRLGYRLALPAIRLAIRRTNRAYVVVRVGDELLVVKNWLSRQNWQLPGGGVKAHETPAVAAARELEEELSVKVDHSKPKLIKEGIWRNDRLGFSYHVFVISIDKKPVIKHRPLELVDAGWLKLEQASNANPEIQDCLAGLKP